VQFFSYPICRRRLPSIHNPSPCHQHLLSKSDCQTTTSITVVPPESSISSLLSTLQPKTCVPFCSDCQDNSKHASGKRHNWRTQQWRTKEEEEPTIKATFCYQKRVLGDNPLVHSRSNWRNSHHLEFRPSPVFRASPSTPPTRHPHHVFWTKLSFFFPEAYYFFNFNCLDICTFFLSNLIFWN